MEMAHSHRASQYDREAQLHLRIQAEGCGLHSVLSLIALSSFLPTPHAAHGGCSCAVQSHCPLSWLPASFRRVGF